ncbi:MAG TPA: PAS domain S-box protein [Chitinophagaceae bacterium]|nr:PAS domain S-box protein [Chitinophagaceae bacterium]
MKFQPEKILSTGLSVIIASILFIVFIFYQQSKKVQDTALWVSHTNKVLYHSESLLAHTADNVAQARGYALSGSGNFLDHLQESQKTIYLELAELKMLTDNKIEQQQRIDSLTDNIDKRVEFSNRIITARQEKGLAAAAALSVTEEGLLYMNRTQELVYRLQADEKVFLDQQTKKNEQSVALMNRVLLLLALMILILLVVLIKAGRKIFQAQKRLQKQLEQSNLILDKKIKKKATELTDVFERITDAFVALDKNWCYTYMNKKAGEIFNRDPEKMIGRHIWTEFPEGIDQSFYKAYHEAMAEQQYVYVEVYHLPYDKWFENHIYPSANGLSIFFRDITERKKAEKKLIQLSQAVEQSPASVIITDVKGNIEYVNKQFTKAAGYSSEEVLGINPRFLKSGHTSEAGYENLWATIISGNEWRGEFHNKKKNGELYWEAASISPIFNTKGEITSFLAIKEDITERKKAAETLRESEETFHRLFNETADPVLLLDETEFIDCNQSAISILGYSFKQEVTNKKPWDISPEKQPDGKLSVYKAKEMIAKSLELGYNQFEWVHTKSDGTEFPVEVMLTPIHLKGKQLFYTLWRDISERKKAEAEKQKALERYDILSQATSDTIWDWDMVNNSMLYNEGITNMFGYKVSDVKNVADWWNDKLHKDDFDMVAAALYKIFENKQKYFQLTYRFRCADGSYKNIFDRAFVLFDDEGTPLRMIGAMQDITYQKEEEIRIGRVVIDAQERERQALGMELHDNVKQILSATLLYLGMANDKKKSKKETTEYIELCHGFIMDSIKEIRRLSHQLAPASFEGVPLPEVIEALVQNMNPDNHWQVNLDMEEDGIETISSEVKINLYRILQEQLNNVVKYAAADHIDVSLKPVENFLQLRIADNGKGFDPVTVKKGIGLENIRKRTEVFSGELVINAAPGKGCELIVKVPLN